MKSGEVPLLGSAISLLLGFSRPRFCLFTDIYSRFTRSSRLQIHRDTSLVSVLPGRYPGYDMFHLSSKSDWHFHWLKLAHKIRHSPATDQGPYTVKKFVEGKR